MSLATLPLEYASYLASILVMFRKAANSAQWIILTSDESVSHVPRIPLSLKPFYTSPISSLSAIPKISLDYPSNRPTASIASPRIDESP